jgi:hypothetical protein
MECGADCDTRRENILRRVVGGCDCRAAGIDALKTATDELGADRCTGIIDELDGARARDRGARRAAAVRNALKAPLETVVLIAVPVWSTS